MNNLIPHTAHITHIYNETKDIKTFRIAGGNGGQPFTHQPGQCAMLGIPGVGEGMFSIASSPTQGQFLEFSIKAVGKLTNMLHTLPVNAPLTIRGPFGTPFPVQGELKGRDLFFAAGGIGIAPLRSVIHYIFNKREEYGAVDILYGARSSADLVYANEMQKEWASIPHVRVFLTIDRPEEGWCGHVGFVPAYIKEISLTKPPHFALICGPPVMIKHSLGVLSEIGLTNKQIYTTLEMRMKCGIGKCGRCNIGQKYVCADGPVFRVDALENLPEEF
jgi:NAD(P)H-flavin reductase